MTLKYKIIYPLVIIVLIIACGWLAYKNIVKDRQIARDSKNVKKAVTIIERRTDELGQNHVVFNADAQNITRNQVKQLPIKNTLDTVAKALDIQAKQIEQWQKIAITSQARELKARATIDSLKKKTRYTYQNKWVSLGYTMGNLDTLKNIYEPGTFDYKYSVDLNHTQYRKKGQSLIDVFLTDTNGSISGLDRYTIVPKKPFVTGSVKQNNTYNRSLNEIKSGAVGELNFGKLSVEGSFYYNYMTKKFEDEYGLGFKIGSGKRK